MTEGYAAFAERFVQPRLQHMSTTALTRLRERLAAVPVANPAAAPVVDPVPAAVAAADPVPAHVPASTVVIIPPPEAAPPQLQQPQQVIVRMSEQRPARDPNTALLAALTAAIVALSKQRPTTQPIMVRNFMPPVKVSAPVTVHLPPPGKTTQSMEYDDQDRIIRVTKEG